MPTLRTLLAGVLLLAACGGRDACRDRPPPTPLDRATTGTITGTVRFEGPVPAMAPLALRGEPACAAQHAGPVPAGDVLVHDGKLENVFVWVKEGLGDRVFAPPDTPVTVDQRGCVYVPHVAGVQTCQEVVFLNSDPLLHNVHGTPARSASWNFSMGVQGSRRAVRLSEPEVPVEVRCDVHPWMRAYLGVVSHPYFAVTGADGRFTLADVPPGEYVVAAWHERFGVREATVALAPRQATDVAFAFRAEGSS
jgi:hypothetical protein